MEGLARYDFGTVHLSLSSTGRSDLLKQNTDLDLPYQHRVNE